MSCTRAKIVAQARSWIGCKESDGSHRKIIDTYNAHKPRARGYKLQYDDFWCAGFASACAIACGATDIIPTEVGCQKQIELFQKKGIWVENDAYIPLSGDYVFYDWQDKGTGDNRGHADHVGIVEKMEDGVITVIEGNYSNAVKCRTLEVNGKYIRGYGVPKYDAEDKPAEPEPVSDSGTATMYYNVRLPRLEFGSIGPTVKNFQNLLLLHGEELPKYGADGEFGDETGDALESFQRKNSLTVDRIGGPQVWTALITT